MNHKMHNGENKIDTSMPKFVFFVRKCIKGIAPSRIHNIKDRQQERSFVARDGFQGYQNSSLWNAT